jgi:hypothetical protein
VVSMASSSFALWLLYFLYFWKGEYSLKWIKLVSAFM